VQVPFTQYFKLEPLLAYHKVIPMEDFMENVAPKIWPAGKRTGNCIDRFFKTKIQYCLKKLYYSILLHGQRNKGDKFIRLQC